MPLEFEKKRVLFRGQVGVDEAEALLEWLQQHPSGKADLSACAHVHPANLQVLLAARTPVQRWPDDADLRRWLEPVLNP